MGNGWDKMMSSGNQPRTDSPGEIPTVTETEATIFDFRTSCFPYLGDIDSYGENNDGMDSDCSASSNSGKQVNVGICAMAKKTQSKPMKEILTRLQEFEYIKIIVFPEDVIIKEAVENWPVCDCLISFHSKGFPLDKAIQYAQLRKPYVINNLHMQYDIQDRRRVYAILESEGIEIPRYAVLDRDSPDPKKHELIESEDHVEVNGVTFNKPFVEKPVSAEDHNIYIYYPTSAGGGSQRLFRKIGSRSSVYSPESRVRKTGSFIYEDFMPTDGTDVKVYTVGPDYAHAEARKSPALDGKVERDSEGKEIRYPVILNNAEKLISRKVCLAFKQTVCGFDLLRANGKSYVCDVNGFSFVKNSNKYYDDCAKILGNMILRELTPTLHIPWSVPFQLDDPPIVPTTFGKMMELRCVVAVIRHGDRTPKQKMKVEVRHPKFFEIFEKYDGYKHGHVKLKRPKQLQEILDIARSLLAEIQTKAADSEIEEKQGKLEQLKSVLEMYGHFSGINRKVQMKYQPKGRPRGSSSDDGNGSSSNSPQEPSLVLILKWGGELTPAGRIQAEELGRIFRCMYPGGQGRHDYSGTQGLGLLRLHSTFRHDLKIYASDEGRVQMTAAAFAKGLLALEGELTPILVQMVKSANTNGLLDNDCDSSKYQNMAKNRLHELMQIDRDFTKEDREAINPGNSISINQAMDFVKNPVKCCAHVHSLIQSLLAVINVKKDDPKTKDAILYHGETWDLMGRRWEKIEKDFSTKSKAFDISKIPDIYDCIKYDLQHNQHTLQYEQAEELYIYAKYLADIVIPQEYGLSMQEKLTIGQGICTPLLKKIKADLQRNIEEAGDESVNRLNPRYSHGVSSPGRHVRTRLYFTSESHVHSLLTVLRYGGLLNVGTDEQWRRAMEYISMVSELNYMSQIVIMLYEDPTKDPSSEERFHVELHFSPGVNCCVQKNLPPGPGFRPHSRNDSGQSKKISPEDSNPTRIDEEIDVNLEDSPLQNSKNPSENTSSPEEVSEIASLSQTEFRCGRIKQSNPIPISHHHTVCGHEAMDLAKRLSEELAAQQNKTGSLDANRAESPDPPEPRSRSYEQQPKKDHKENSKTNDILDVAINSPPSYNLLFKIETSTNELPLYEINFSMNPLSPELLLNSNPMDLTTTGSQLYEEQLLLQKQQNPNSYVARISPVATNERPLSCTCLTSACSEGNINFHQEPSPLPRTTLLLSKPILISSHKTSATTATTATFFSSSTDHINNNRETHDTFADLYHTSCSAPAILDLYTDPSSNKNAADSTFRSSDQDKQLCKFLPVNSAQNCCSMSLVSHANLTVPTAKRHSIQLIKSDNSLDTLHKSVSNTFDSNQSNIDNYLLNVPIAPLSISTKTTTTATTNKFHPIITNLNPSVISPILTPTPHQNTVKIHNSDTPATIPTSSGSTSSGTTRRQRHSIAGQMNYFKMLGFGGFGKKIATSTNSLFSTAVISGSSSAPNLRDMIPSTATPSVLEGFGGVPPIRPLETLHNALSLKQLDGFLEKMTTAPLFKTPASSPPKNPSTPVPSTHSSISTGKQQPDPICWSGQSSMNSSGDPSSPNVSEDYSREYSSSDMSASLASVDGLNILQKAEEISRFFPKLDDDLNSVCVQLNMDTNNIYASNLTSVSEISSAAATKGSTTVSEIANDEDDESTISVDTLSTTAGDVDTSLPSVLTASVEKTYPRIQKQISLFEGSSMSSTATDRDVKFTSTSRKLSERRGRFGTIETTLQQSTSNDNFLNKKSSNEAISNRSTKTKSCMNLKSCNFHYSVETGGGHYPGAIVVKEMFIEPPKRVTRSFHGKTEHAGSKSLDEASYATSSINITAQKSYSVQKLRFITTKVDENFDNK